MWIYLLIIAIVIGAIIGYCNNGSKEDAAAGGCMAGMGCLHIIGYLAMTAFSLWIIVGIFKLIFG